MIRQGHLYRAHGNAKCLALETRETGTVRCLTVDDDDLYPEIVWVNARDLAPAPMRYFHGETPR